MLLLLLLLLFDDDAYDADVSATGNRIAPPAQLGLAAGDDSRQSASKC